MYEGGGDFEEVKGVYLFFDKWPCISKSQRVGALHSLPPPPDPEFDKALLQSRSMTGAAAESERGWWARVNHPWHSMEKVSCPITLEGSMKLGWRIERPTIEPRLKNTGLQEHI